tara:strand:- start:163092 stop:164678 length:1587 start_codon:yes stop_codon:yes gene_type:complete
MKLGLLRPLTLSVLAFATLSLSPQTAVSADPVDIDGALYLQNKIQEQINTAGFGLSAEGDVAVEPAGSYYAVTLPHIKFDMAMPPSQSMPNGEKLMLDFGMSALNMVPTDVKGQYIFAQSLPTPWRVYNGEQEMYRIEIGEQKTNGIQDIEMSLTTRLDAEYKNISLIHAASNATIVHIDSITAKGGYDEKTAGFYSGTLPIEINGLKLMANNKPFLTIKKVKAYSGYTDLSRENTTKCMGQMQRLNKQITGHLQREKIVTPKVIATYLDNVLACTGIIADGMEGGLVVEGVNIGPEISAMLGVQNILFKSFYTQSQLTDISKEKMGVSVKFGMQEMDMQPWPESFSKFSPRSIHADIGLDNIPHGKLHEIIRGVLAMYSQDAAQVTANPAMVLMPILARLPQLLNEAESGIVAKDIRIAGEGYQALLKGRLQSDISAIYGFSGKANLTFYNMDKFMEGITAEAQDPNNPNAAGMMPMLAPVTMLQKLGKDDGQGNRVFEFELTPQGKSTLNGESLMKLLAPPQAVPQ